MVRLGPHRWKVFQTPDWLEVVMLQAMGAGASARGLAYPKFLSAPPKKGAFSHLFYSFLIGFGACKPC